MTLREKRCLFTRLSAGLPAQAAKLGCEFAWDQAGRSNEQAEINAIGEAGRERVADLVMAEFPELAKKLLDNGKAGGIRLSIHQLGLALDGILWRDGIYLTQTKDYEPLGEWWEKQHELCRWGGRFRDGNHFSMEHNGVK